MEMDVDAVFETYDANSDGRIEHSEYVEKHKAEVEGGGISAVIDRLLDDSPELVDSDCGLCSHYRFYCCSNECLCDGT